MGCDLLNWTEKEDLVIASPPGLDSLPRHGTTPDVILHHEELQLLQFELIDDGVKHGSDHSLNRPTTMLQDLGSRERGRLWNAYQASQRQIHFGKPLEG